MTEQEITVALAGNPNSGKTTVFNNLTGARQHVGNWPGVTVEKKDGYSNFKGHSLKVVDLPGVYSLTAYSLDEVIARNYIIDEKPDVVVDIVDASNLERNLYLTVQLLEMQANLVIALNIMDVAESRGYEVDVDGLSHLLGTPVIPMVAARGQGTRKLLQALVDIAEGSKKVGGLRLQYGHDVEAEIAKLEKLVAGSSIARTYSPRWLAVKLLEEDREIVRKIRQELDGEQVIRSRDESLAHLRKVHGDDAGTLIASARYGFISGLMKDVLKKPAVERITATDRIDRLMLNRWLGIPFFLAILFGVFQFTFVVSEPLIQWIDTGLGWLEGQVAGISPAWLSSLIADGIIGGVGSVLSFVPVIFLLYLALSVLEDSGYMARAAFVMDRLMHKIGLHGRSFVALMLGFGCSVAAIMSCRTIDNPKDRLVTILVIPLMSCGGRLPIYAFFAAAFFTAHQGLVVFSMYAIGVVLAIILAWVFRKRLVAGESGHFVMELPAYHLPTIPSVLAHTWERGWAFLSRAGTIIFGAVVLIWFLNYFGTLEYIGRAVAPVFLPAGFGQWQAAVALIFGVLAKETVVGTFGALFAGATGSFGHIIGMELGWTPLVAFAFMTMVLLYIPCVATLSIVRRETGSWRWTLFTIGYTLVVGWTVATLIYQIGRLFA
jgi:ferrous iron transport protein B